MFAVRLRISGYTPQSPYTRAGLVPISTAMSDPVRPIPQRILHDQSGVSLFEVLAALAIFAVVLSAVMLFLDTSAHTIRRDAERNTAVVEAQSQLNGMVREFRQATSFADWGPNFTDFFIGTKEIRYQCDVADPANASRRRCVRVEASGGAALPAISSGRVVASRVLNGTAANPVFEYTIPPDPPPDPDDEAYDPTDPPPPLQPTFVKVRLELPAGGERPDGYKHTVVLDSGLYLRNVDPAAQGTGA
jgi:prepilin-type N-terminal cleavage/methylation domain-containing protein